MYNNNNLNLILIEINNSFYVTTVEGGYHSSLKTYDKGGVRKCVWRN